MLPVLLASMIRRQAATAWRVTEIVRRLKNRQHFVRGAFALGQATRYQSRSDGPPRLHYRQKTFQYSPRGPGFHGLNEVVPTVPLEA